ncbi:cysteine-rich receptor-like protein kinase 44 [Apium graveolens]|uniref:cysteine-rich receptor-like protein kinase 44 n=1 Tax=Apium graveolens TaxID=4045 RepID=UPI003D7B07DD
MVQFNQDLRDLMDNLKAQAIQTKFATGKKRGPDFDTIYGLVQCTPDLSSVQCSDCLDNAFRYISACCSGRVGGQILKPSCRLRFEVSRFYNQTTVIDAQPPQSQLPPPVAGKDDNNIGTVIVIVVVTVGFVILLLVLVCIIKRKRKQRIANGRLLDDNIENINSTESLQYNFGTVEVATDQFSDSNKLGEGGFGAVYKGTLQNGEEIAVKRLSTGSNQGQQEFKNEVTLVAKLQHRNLVRLLGFCFEGTERLLVYEFVPNASLDQFIFDSERRSYMDWEKRYRIIGGVARGLLYLHEDSRLRIIHRDLKASNVLLDAEMNPKIADFGMAKLFNIDETQGMTNKIVGTYGYMAPEYAMYGQFSVKSDVFSFGVLILEILTGRKNHFFQNGENVDLASFVWNNWREGTAVNIIDPILRNNSVSIREMIRCIHIGLLCLQENVTNRPTMASVMRMLNSLSLTLQVPSELPLLSDNINSSGSHKSSDCSVDRAPITHLHPR